MVTPRFFLDPVKGTTLPEEIACYSLPYGGLGFLSHVLTYYTMLCLCINRRPIMPWKGIKYGTVDLILAVVGLIGGLALSIFTIVRCRNSWQLLSIAVWKLSMSLLNGLIGTHVAVVGVKAVREVGYQDTVAAASWIMLYIPGVIAGFAGLLSLVTENWTTHPHLKIVTYAFSGVIGVGLVIIIICALIGYCDPQVSGESMAIGAGYTFGVFFIVVAALYSDWTLGVIANNLLGVPSGDNSALYWSYFASKRLTMFSF